MKKRKAFVLRQWLTLNPIIGDDNIFAAARKSRSEEQREKKVFRIIFVHWPKIQSIEKWESLFLIIFISPL